MIACLVTILLFCVLVIANNKMFGNPITDYFNLFLVCIVGYMVVFFPLHIAYFSLAVRNLLTIYFSVWVLLISSFIGRNLKPRKQKLEVINISLLEKIIWPYLILGILANVIYLWPYGSYQRYLDYSLDLRVGNFLIYNRFSFLQPFGDIFYVSSLFFLGLEFHKHSKKNLFGLLLSVYLEILILIANRGRMSFISFLAVMLISTVNIVFARKKIFKVILVFVIFLTFISLTEEISNAMGRGAPTDPVAIIVEGTYFITNNIINVFRLPKELFRRGLDVFFPFVFLLPSRIWEGKLGMKTVSEQNTFFLEGAYKGQSGVTGELPVDLISFCYYEFGILGFMIVGIIAGMIIGYFIRKIRHLPTKAFQAIFKMYFFIQFILRSFLVADPANLITRFFGIIVFFVVYKGFKVLYLLKQRSHSRTKYYRGAPF
ncbi:O-antigen polymerase [Sphaerochaeta pleomorpha]|uniref:O-antigen polymerase n=1 Tax=Sphaerochaeta pleomorpha TaxID=1131707 RepID=UPI00155A64C4|nr:O-antigen polymerase [Sphaerochaeta pleomorpha]